MKRSIDSSSNLNPLKRANSSLFSIATLVDDEAGVDKNMADSLLCGGLQIEEKAMQSKSAKVRKVSSGGELCPLLNVADDDGPPREDASSSCSEAWELSHDSQETEPTTDAIDSEAAAAAEHKDHRTGLIFESASNHFDRHNKFHKERPQRITSVYNYLSNKSISDGKQSVFERCQLIEMGGETDCDTGEKSDEDLFLDDNDYLRVHLPGYVQR